MAATSMVKVVVTIVLLTLFNINARAAGVNILVTDTAGQPLTDAVVYAEPASGQALPKLNQPVEIEQKGRKFHPMVTAIQAGTMISLPNRDSVRHHVYSFSPAKTFEIKLYSGVPSSPFLFDKTGTVVLGCNIHDKMLAYIHIVDTPYFAKTNQDGIAKLDSLIAGKYLIKAWHFQLPVNAAIPEQPLHFRGNDESIAMKLDVKPTPTK